MTELERRAGKWADELPTNHKAQAYLGYLTGYLAALAESAKASWDAINQRWPDGTMHDVQEVANTAIRKLGEQ